MGREFQLCGGYVRSRLRGSRNTAYAHCKLTIKLPNICRAYKLPSSIIYTRSS